MTDKIVIAIDGPSGVGKSSLGKELARRLDLLYVDSGAVYRAVAQRALDMDTSIENAQAMGDLASDLDIRLEGEPDNLRVYVDSRDVTGDIRKPEVSHASSVIATNPRVRDEVVNKLRAMGGSRGVVMDGRDIGTRVFPDARVKLFLEASPEVRARRRWLEELERGREVTLDDVRAEIDRRDRRDRERAATPLVKADDALLIDTTDTPMEELVERVLEIVRMRS